MKYHQIVTELDRLDDHLLAIRNAVRHAMLDEELRNTRREYEGIVGEYVVWTGEKRKPGEHTRGAVEIFDERIHGNWPGVSGYFHGQLIVRSPRGFRISPYTSKNWTQP
jgi:hypothetical protein